MTLIIIGFFGLLVNLFYLPQHLRISYSHEKMTSENCKFERGRRK